MGHGGIYTSNELHNIVPTNHSPGVKYNSPLTYLTITLANVMLYLWRNAFTYKTLYTGTLY